MASIYPVILSGGSGTRLWPVSRSMYPKQLMALYSDKSLLQDAALRTSGVDFMAPIVICNEDHRFIVAEQLREVAMEPAAIILEPVGRNTAPAATIAAQWCEQNSPGSYVLLMPSDHVIRDVEAFKKVIKIAVNAAAKGDIVTFGLEPDHPETGYGYIYATEGREGVGGCKKVSAFKEKPDLETAEKYLESGDYLWNSGIFLYQAQSFLAEIGRLSPDTVRACQESLEKGHEELDFCRLDHASFAAAPKESIDYAVMEKTEKASVVPISMGWNDLGAWPALWDISEKDENGNVILGDVLTAGCANNYIRAESKLVATVGLEDTIVVETDDALLVASRDKAQDVKDIVDQLNQKDRIEADFHSRVYRPWGNYRSIGLGDQYQVKEITVKPGAILSLQYHHHRAEHWVVVEGVATVTRGDDVFDLKKNESTFIPLGVKHRLENRTSEPLKIIEVQSGDYLGEDDIVRLEDLYGRNEEKPA